ncbi:DUF559 domain-containing protein [Priestia sp. JV24]|uniref:endonuclease domain-containing protein n=1 Tax=Priestia TaxID=2800373 RepID=UPI0021D6522E|nr:MULTISPECIES: DUF559 domain-containing protein [Priestia]MCU7712988.1 DUF559 domain-containing protein [Priestia megaterium]MCW1049173.1 DUF559 domain-containing protein [Priestia sp. JV24]
MVIEYVFFIALCGLGLIVFILHEIENKGSKSKKVKVDRQYKKCGSYIEKKLYQALVFNGFKVRTQVKCGNYRIDLALMKHNIAIECDGHKYHSTSGAKKRDKRKDKYLKDCGWKVLRFTGSAINGDVGKVVLRIKDELEKVSKTI